MDLLRGRGGLILLYILLGTIVTAVERDDDGATASGAALGVQVIAQ
jgi:hypothetical protein